MKQQILNLKKKLLLIELPEGHNHIAVFPRPSFLTTWDKDSYTYTHKLDFNVEEIGELTDITEEQFADFISSKWMLTTNSDNVLRYKDYMAIFDPYNKKTAKESFFSYLEANGVYFKNNNRMPSATIWQTDQIMYNRMEKVFQEAEQKVWNLDNTYLFEIL